MLNGERSNLVALRGLVWIALRLGRPIARSVLIPVALYFVLFSRKARSASQDYLQRVHGRDPSLRLVFMHFYAFATVALDRVYFLTGKWSNFDIRLFGKELLIEKKSRNEGCFLIGAHLGSFECLRALGRNRSVDVKLVMYEQNARNVARMTRAINPGLEQDIISLGEPDSMLRVIEQLEMGNWVGMLGDRALNARGLVKVPFLGGIAAFPAAPFRVAAIAGRPLVMMFGLYRGGNRYDVHVENLVDSPALPRKNRDQIIESWVRLYADRVAYYCREAPLNWFNFFPFWAGSDESEEN